MPDFLSTKAKRKAMAAFVSEIASEVFGSPVVLTETEYSPGEFDYHLGNFESDRGAVAWVHIDVCPRGVNVHTKFGAPQFAPPGANPHSGKWNHYIWPRGESDPNEYRETVAAELRRILSEVTPNGRTRQNLPDLSGYWAQQRAEFAARCAT